MPRPFSSKTSRTPRAGGLAIIVAAAWWWGGVASAQPISPVFVDDSPLAAAGLIRAGELTAMGNLDEAVRVLQGLLDTAADRLLPVDGDPDVFTPVRGRIHETLLARPALLERYLALQSTPASEMLARGDLDALVRTRWLTPAGFEATLRLAQDRLEAAQFHSARQTLEELDLHPGRVGANCRHAAELLSRVAAYLGADMPPASLALLSRWREAAGVNPAPVEPAPTPALARAVSPLTPARPTDLSELLPRPLWSDALGDRLPFESAGQPRNAANPPRETALWLYALPTAVGDTVYVSDTQTVTAWNRFTLSRVWRWKTEGVQGRRFAIGPAQNFEEVSAVAADESHVVALMGLAIQNTPTPRRTLICIDPRTGQTIWERLIEDLGLPELSEAVYRGPAMLDQGIVVVLVERDINRRRLDSIAALGLDVRTAEARWHTPLASTGSLAYGFRSTVVDTGAVHGGIAYLTNRLGFIAALETVSGRVRWIRRWPATLMNTTRADQPWESNTPVLTPRGLFAVAPDRKEVILLDAETGRLVARCPASKFDNPEYLLLARERIVGVSSTSMVSARIEAFGPEAATTRIARFSSGMLRGRALAFGGTVMAPMVDGVAVYDPASDGEPIIRIPLDKPGNLLPLDGQLLVVDDREVHTYLVWDSAERMLRRRMEEMPDDPAPATTYAELSFRAGRADGILPAVDRALSAIESAPLSPTARESQAKLFAAVFAMVEPASDAAARVPLSLALRGALIDRLDRCATSADERVAYLLTSGRFSEATDQPARAVANYQAILDSPDLSASTFTQAETIVSADYEATRRLRRLIQMYGVRLYDAYQADADRRLADLAQSLDPEPFESLARRYPVARAAVTAWLEASARHASQGRPKLAVQALEEGLAASRYGLAPDDPLHGELAGRLVRHLVSTGLVHPARAVLESFRKEHPTLRLTDQGQTLDADALASSIRAEIDLLDRRPRIGPKPTASSSMPGWVVLTPLDEESPQSVGDRALLMSDDGEIAMFRVAGPGPPARLWGGVRDEDYLWMDPEGVSFAREIGEGDRVDYIVVRRDLNTGKTLWETPAFRTVFPPGPIDELLADPAREFVPVIDTPLQPRVPVKQVSFLFDRRTLVLLDRLGRTAAFDLATGRLLWSQPTTVPRMHDAALAAGTLLIGGADGPVDLARPLADAHAGEPMTGVALALDARTGQVLNRYETPSRVRWVRLAPEGFSIVGLDDAVVSLDPYRGRVRWRASAKPLVQSLHGWTLPGRTIVRTDANTLIQINSEDGAVRAQPLDSRGRLEGGFGFVQVATLGEHTSVLTRLGLAVFNPAGDLIGIDARERDAPLLFAAFGEKYSITITTDPDPPDNEASSVLVNVFANPSLRIMSRTAAPLGALAGDAGPFRILDGKLLISGGETTTVVDIPPAP